MSAPPLLLANAPQRSATSSSVDLMFNDDESDRIQKVYANHREAVCMIVREDGKTGTGCLIGGDLIITNHHVLDSKDTTRRSEAIFFYVTQQSADKKDTDLAVRKFELKPDVFFLTSEATKDDRGRPLPAAIGFLDCTIVAIEHKEHLACIQAAAFSIFDAVGPTPGHGACVIHHPKRIDHNTYIERDRKKSEGRIVCNGSFSTYYNAETASGSSGGVVLDTAGRFMALHYQGGCECECTVRHRGLNSGVLIAKIAEHFLDQRLIIEERILETKKFLAMMYPEREVLSSCLKLPEAPKHFTGRATELAQLRKLCKTNNRVAITGLGGIGKTALVLKYAAESLSRFNIVYFINAFNSEAINNGLIQLADDLKIKGTDAKDRLEQLKKTLRGRRDCLLIFDGADNSDCFDHLKTCLPDHMRCTIVTTRMSAKGEDTLQCASLTLDQFALADALDYIGKRTRQTEDASLLAERLGCLPLALAHACAYVNRRNIAIARFLKEFDDQQTALFGEVIAKLTGEQTIATTWNMTLQAMSPDAIELMQFCAFLSPSDIPLSLLQSWVDTQKQKINVGECLTELTDYSMMTGSRPEFFSVHLLVQQVIRNQLGIEKAGNYIETSLQACVPIAASYCDTDPKTWTPLHDIAAHLSMVLSYAHLCNDPHTLDKTQPLIQYALGLHFQNAIVDLPASEQYFKNALQIYKKQADEERPMLGVVLNNLCSVLQKQNKLDEAMVYIEQALLLYERPCDEEVHHIALTLNTLGTIQLSLGKKIDAQLSFERSADLYKSLYGDTHPFVARALSNIGSALQAKGNFSEAEPWFLQALDIYTALHEEGCLEAGLALNNIGAGLMFQNQLEKAKTYLEKSLTLYRTLYGETHSALARMLNNLGCLLQEQDNPDEAISYFQQALFLYKEAFGEKHPDVALALNNIGSLFLQKGDLKSARIYLEQAFDLREALCKNEDIASILRNMGAVLQAEGQLSEATSYFRQALALFRQAYGEQQHVHIVSTLDDIGETLKSQNQLDHALPYFKQVLEGYKDLYGEIHWGVAKALQHIGDILIEQDLFDDEGLEHLKRSFGIYKQIYSEKHPSALTLCFTIGGSLCMRGNLVEALPYLEHTVRFFHLLPGSKNNPLFQAIYQSMLDSSRETLNSLSLYEQGIEHRDRGELEQAKDFLAQAYRTLAKMGLPETEACYTALMDITKALSERDLLVMQKLSESLLGDLD